MTVPTVGRIVWYFASSSQINPLPAQVCAVTEEEVESSVEGAPPTKRYFLNLAAHNAEGHPFNRIKVPLIQADEARIDSEHCMWMPYQIQQAAKAEVQSAGS